VAQQWHGFFMASEADCSLRREQIQRRHVASCLDQVADSARKRHSGMHGLAFGFIRVAGGTNGILGEDARVLDGGCLRGANQQRQESTDQRTGHVFHFKFRGA
jgi:hypothetical protein